MAGSHAQIAPSALDIIVRCHAHVQMAAPYANDPPTEEQLEGDAAHWLALQYVNGNAYPVSTMTPQGIPVDEDMVAGAVLWRDTVGLYGVAEQLVVCPRVHPTQCWGTPDWWRWDAIERILRVKDYKYGHKFVEVFENWQMGAGYAPGILDMLEINGWDEQDVRVELTVVQPRSYHPEGPVRTWGPFPASDLRAMVNQANHAAEMSLQPKPTATAGTHCEFCPGRHECRTLQLAAARIAEFMSTMERVNMPAPALAAELTILDAAAEQLEARRTGLQAQALAMLRRGEQVPGFKIEHPAGRLKWTVATDEVVALGQIMEKDLRKPLEVITPTQAIAAGIDAAVIAAYADRPKGAAKLSVDTNIQARKVFGANAT